MSTGLRVKEYRTEQGLSLRALARLADVSVGYLAKLEQDLSSPTVAMLERLAQALNVKPADLLSGESTAPMVPVLPASLLDFIDRYKEVRPELLNPDWQRALSQVRFRGKYPEDPDDWMRIFMSMQGALED